jgi:YidC/Oxa1 family membrane protein insertase
MRFMSVWMMPIMMFFICNNLSAALSYYYLLSQLISIVQTWAIRRSINKDEILAKVRASAGKPVQKSKWQQRLEEAQKMQEKMQREQQKRR